MLPTPSTSHVNYDRIYEPAEDSFLLLDTLSSESEKAFLRERFPSDSPSPIVVEVGTGSGVVLAFVTANVTHIFGRSDVASLGIDLNEFASAATAQTVAKAVKTTGRSAGDFLGCAIGDLVSPLKSAAVDVLIFNPPYVPTEALPSQDLAQRSGTVLSGSAAFERDSHLLSLSYAGGIDGMETTNRLLADCGTLLSPRGVAYVLLCAQNRPDNVIARISAWPGRWSAERISSSGKTAGWEKLCVLRICRATD